MSQKTDMLTQLFPEAYAARDPGSLLYRLLDAIGAELSSADDALKTLLKSHWVHYASGAALDGLGASFGVSRRTLRGGAPESDDAFRVRLRSVVPLFTGGGTVRAVKGAVRSALGLPFDLADLKLDPASPLLQELEALVQLDEFSPKPEEVSDDRVAPVTVAPGVAAHELVLVVDVPGVYEEWPRIVWTFTSGAARFVSVERRGAPGLGVASGDLLLPAGSVLILAARDGDGALSASVGTDDVTGSFTDLDGHSPPRLPVIPQGRSEWVFRARSGFDQALFDTDTFDLPTFRVELQWQRRQPLTFDIHVPFFLSQTVEALAKRYGYTGNPLVYEGIPLERLQEVVNETQAAGVRGNVHFSLLFFDDHSQHERLVRSAEHRRTEDSRLSESQSPVVGSLSTAVDRQELQESFGIGGLFDLSTFDGSHVFTEQ